MVSPEMLYQCYANASIFFLQNLRSSMFVRTHKLITEEMKEGRPKI